MPEDLIKPGVLALYYCLGRINLTLGGDRKNVCISFAKGVGESGCIWFHNNANNLMLRSSHLFCSSIPQLLRRQVM